MGKTKLGLVRKITDLSPACYRLSTDGRKWKSLCEARQKLANWLALKANPDGTQIFPGIAKMIRVTGWSHGKVCYVLDDLQAIGCIVSERKRTKERGTRLRRFEASPLLTACAAIARGETFSHTDSRPGATVQDSPEKPIVEEATVQDSPEPTIQHSEATVQDSELQSNLEDLQSNPGLDTTVLSDRQEHTDHPTAEKKSVGLVGWMGEQYGQKKGKILSVSNDEREQLETLTEEHAPEMIRQVWSYWLENREKGFIGLVHKVTNFVKEFSSAVGALEGQNRNYSAEDVNAAMERHRKKIQADNDRFLAERAQQQELEASAGVF